MTWRVAKSLEVFRGQLDGAAPSRSRTHDGGIGDDNHRNRSSDHNPWCGPVQGLWVVTARDFTHDPDRGVDIDELTDQLVASRDPRIKYLIANSLILDTRPRFKPWTWQKYTGPNPHEKHFHLSVSEDPALFDSETLWDLPMFRKSTPVVRTPMRSDGKRLLFLTEPRLNGEDVRELQRVLKAWYPFLNVTVDGWFGPDTERAVKECQRRAGLAQDGVVGPATRKVLGL